MNVNRNRLRRSLHQQLEALAAPADRALASVPAGGVKADELALDFDNFYHAYVGNIGDELSPDARAALSAVDKLLKRMSGSANAALWTEDAVAHHPAWLEVRLQASRALELFGEAPAE